MPCEMTLCLLSACWGPLQLREERGAAFAGRTRTPPPVSVLTKHVLLQQGRPSVDTIPEGLE